MFASGQFFLETNEAAELRWVSGSFDLGVGGILGLQFALEALEGDHVTLTFWVERSVDNFSFFPAGAEGDIWTLDAVGLLQVSVDIGAPAKVRVWILLEVPEPPMSARGTLTLTGAGVKDFAALAPNPLKERLPPLLINAQGPVLPAMLVPKELRERILRQSESAL